MTYSPHSAAVAIIPSTEYQVLRNVDCAMRTLSRDHRSLLINICVKGMKYEEVAKNLGIPVGTVRQRLVRARENLATAMESHLPNPASGGNPAYAPTALTM